MKLTTHKQDGTFFAVKSVSLWESQTAYAIDCEADKQTMKTITAEVNALRQHNCKYLITFYGAYYDAIGGSANFILEYMDVGSLQKVLKEGSSLPKNIVSHITCDALKGLQYIHHTLKMIHRDFKPGNLLLNKRGDVKVTDFGVSRGLESSADSCNSYVGTLIYMAPERVPGGHAKAEYTNKVDIWAVGITVFQMVTGKHPYQQHQAFLDYFQVVELSPSLDQEHDDDLREFVDLALQQEPQNRPDCATLLSTPLMKSIEAISREPEFKTEYIQWLEVCDKSVFSLLW